MNKLKLRICNIEHQQLIYDSGEKKDVLLSLSIKLEESSDAMEILPGHSPLILGLNSGAYLLLRYSKDSNSEFRFDLNEELNLTESGILTVKNANEETTVEINLTSNNINVE